MFNYEKCNQKPLTKLAFILRFARSVITVLLIVGVALLLGMIGYRETEGYTWTDAYLNASMILGGMGPVNPVVTEAGKIFAGSYALFSGLAFLVLAGLLFAPIAHRILHGFHYDADKKSDNP